MNNAESSASGQPHYTDEVSLRDLYLILKKGALWIVLVAVLAGVAAFIYFSMQPETYSAESTTLVTPLVAAPSLDVGAGDSLRVADGVTVQYETYQTLANSRPVIESVIQSVPDYDGGLRALERSMSLERLLGPANPGQSVPLAVTHTVSNQSPELAAELADAWAIATLAVVQESILDDLRPMREATTQALAATQLALEEIEGDLRDFQAVDEISQRQGQQDAAVADLIAAEQTLRSLESSIAVKQAERTSLLQQIEAEQSLLTTTDLTSTGFLAGMTLEEAAEFVGGQLAVARREHTGADEALRDFDRTSGLTLLAARQENLELTIAADTATLLNLEHQIALAESGLEAQLAELALQPDRLVVFQSLLDDAVMLEGWRNQSVTAEELQNMAELTVFAEQLNPHYQNLVGRTLESRLNIAALQAQQTTLSDSLAEFQQQLQEVRDERFQIESARLELELAAAEANAEYESLVESSLHLHLANQRPNSEALELASDTGVTAQLRTQLREIDIELVTLNAEVTEVRSDIGELNALIAGHRDAVATLNLQKAILDREVELRRSAFANVAVVQPLLEFFGDLAPGNARIMTEAVIPEEAEGGRLLPTLLAVVVAGLLATVFVFLREAVREPDEPGVRRRAPAAVPVPSTD